MLALTALTTALSLPWRTAIAPAPPLKAKIALASALDRLDWPEEATPDLVLLSVPQEHSADLNDLTAEAAKELNAKFLIGVVGAGVIGAGKEMDQGNAGISLLAGVFPEATEVTPFVVGKERMPNWSELCGTDDAPRPSFILFADPFSPVTQATSIINSLAPSSCVAGGLTCPTSEMASSISMSTSGGEAETLPPGSCIGLSLRGPNFELHSLTAQGAAPVGPSWLVTAGGGEGSENLVMELDGQPALARLQELASEQDERVLRLLKSALLVGIEEGTSGIGAAAAAGGDDDGGSDGDGGFVNVEPDYLIRQVLGVSNQGGIYVGDRVEAGVSRLQFHVRDAKAAAEELSLRLGRYRLERSMSGRYAAPPLGGLLFSCNGRGRNMYDEADHDSKAVADALGESLPIGGYFCAGEIGPIGVKGLQQASSQSAPTFLHGFTSVLALMYDTSAASSAD